MSVHIFIPDLLRSELLTPEIYRELSLPALETLLAKGSFSDEKSQGTEAWLCSAFGVVKQNDWPVAIITLQVDGAKEAQAKDGYWLRADPVHLRIERNDIILADSQIFEISIDEANQFVSALNYHFSNNRYHSLSSDTEQGKIFFQSIHSDRWYLHLAHVPNLMTCSLNEVAGKNINDFMPSGADSMTWNTISNEIQMLLHEHPLNQAREARGELPINSVWFWGGGIMPQSFNCPYTHIWSNDTFCRSLASISGINYNTLSDYVDKWSQLAISGSHLVMINTLHGRVQYEDIHGWQESIKNLEVNWFAPLLLSLKNGELDQLIITTTDQNRVKNFSIVSNSLWKFWRTNKSLSIYAD